VIANSFRGRCRPYARAYYHGPAEKENDKEKTNHKRTDATASD
jgi:hypothetical protein